MSDWRDALGRCKPCDKGEHEKCTGYEEWCPCIFCFVSQQRSVAPLPHPRGET